MYKGYCNYRISPQQCYALYCSAHPQVLSIHIKACRPPLGISTFESKKHSNLSNLQLFLNFLRYSNLYNSKMKTATFILVAAVLVSAAMADRNIIQDFINEQLAILAGSPAA